jgi:hypothetical protein
MKKMAEMSGGKDSYSRTTRGKLISQERLNKAAKKGLVKGTAEKGCNETRQWVVGKAAEKELWEGSDGNRTGSDCNQSTEASRLWPSEHAGGR